MMLRKVHLLVNPRKTLAPPGVKLLAALMVVFLLLDQVCLASSVYVAYTPMETEGGKGVDSRNVNAEEVLPHSTQRLGVEYRPKKHSAPARTPRGTVGHRSAELPVIHNRLVVFQLSCLRC
jgi:hypothetical protein